MVEPVEGTVKVRVSGVTGRGHVSGVKRCKSMWACPVCAPTMRAARAREITALVERAQSIGHTVTMPTFTFPHQAGEALSVTLGYLQDAWKAMWGGRWAEGFKAEFGVVGQVRSIEVTYGDNGFHPHVHALLFMDIAAAEVDVALVELWVALYRRWCDAVESVCGRRPSSKNGLDLRRVHDAQAVGDYVSDAGGWTVGSEIACSPVKLARSGSSVTMFNMLGAAAMWGDRAAANVWLEYETATAGKHAIRASAGLLDFYGVEQVDDDEAAAPEAEQVVAEVEVDPVDWLLLAEYQITDRFVMAVEEWAATGAGGRPPDPREHVLGVLADRRLRALSSSAADGCGGSFPGSAASWRC